jgi:type II secretory pathway pseudopilin PulG
LSGIIFFCMFTLKLLNPEEKQERSFWLFLKKEKKHRRCFRMRAFSIVEVMISSAVIAVGLTAILQLLASSLASSFRETDAIVAIGLAQEGLEYAYNVRDNNIVNGRPSFPTSGAFKFPGTAGRDFCGPSFTNPGFVLSGASRNCFANATNSEHRYSLNLFMGTFYGFENAITHFARVVSINLDDVTNPGNAEITSIVWWGQSNVRPAGVFPGPSADSIDVSRCTRANQCVYVRAVLADWKP